MIKILIMLVITAVSGSVLAQQWQSAKQQTELVELFTSEGCSSCPRADKWFSMLKDDPRLFNTFVPVAFHVDYWDYIGWKDRFARPEYSLRQQQYAREKLISQVYTPGIIVNSREWRSWFRGSTGWPESTAQTGRLSAELEGSHLHVIFAHKKTYRLYVAYLGMGLQTPLVKSGENRGRTLEHDFVVLNMQSIQGNGDWQLTLSPPPDRGQQRTAIALWISPPDSQQVIQAVGGYLNPDE